MKNLLIFIIALMILPLNYSKGYSQEPYFELQDLNNNWLNYTEVKGERLTIIDFWATWCQPCVRSIPELNQIYREYSPSGVNLIGISVDGPRNQSKLKPFVSSLGVEYTILRDVNSEVMKEMNVISVPTLLILDETGELLFIHEGFRPGDEKILREKINALL